MTTDADPDAGGLLCQQPFTAFRDKTLEQKVQELADRAEITELTARYAHRVARGLSRDDLFTEDGVFILRTPGRPVREVRGRAAMIERHAKLGPTPDNPLPMIHNHLISIVGDEASGLCSNELRITENGRSIIASGYYQDRYRREGGLWKFALRDAAFFHYVPLQEGWAGS